jgi:hypothetical protein
MIRPTLAKLVRRYEATRRDEAKPGPADTAHTRQHVQLDGAVFDVFTLGQNTNLPIDPFLRLETWRVAVCVCRPAGRPVVVVVVVRRKPRTFDQV